MNVVAARLIDKVAGWWICLALGTARRLLDLRPRRAQDPGSVPINEVFFSGRFCSPCMRIDELKSVRCHWNEACLREVEPARVFRSLLPLIRGPGA